MPEIVCPRAALCLLDLAVDEHDESYLFNYDVHLQRYEEYAPGRFAYRDRVYCFAPALSMPVNPKLEVRFDPRRGEYNRRHACHAQGALGLVDTSQDDRERYRCAGFGHAPKPGGDRTTGSGVEQDAHLECRVPRDDPAPGHRAGRRRQRPGEGRPRCSSTCPGRAA